MTVPMVGRWAAAAGGGLLVLIVWASVVETLIVARPVSNWLTRWVDRLVKVPFAWRRAAWPTTAGATGYSPARRRPSCLPS